MKFKNNQVNPAKLMQYAGWPGDQISQGFISF